MDKIQPTLRPLIGSDNQRGKNKGGRSRKDKREKDKGQGKEKILRATHNNKSNILRTASWVAVESKAFFTILSEPTILLAVGFFCLR